MKKQDIIFIIVWIFFFFFGSWFIGNFIFPINFKYWAIFMVLILYFWVKVISPEQKKEWECHYCKKDFYTKAEGDKHELTCKKGKKK